MRVSSYVASAYGRGIGPARLPSSFPSVASSGTSAVMRYHRTCGILPTRDLRMGMLSAAPVLIDFSASSSAFFSGIRLAASLVAGSSLGLLFSLSSQASDLKGKSTMELLFIKVFHVCALASFVSSITAVVFATAAGVSMLHGDFNPMATSGYMLLRNEMEFSFVTTRWSFLTSLLLFLSSVSSRAILEFQLLRRKKIFSLIALIFTMTSLGTFLLSYINTTLYSWDNLADMTVYLMKLIIARAATQRKPLQLISLASAVVAVSSVMGLLFFEPEDEGNND